MLPVTIETKGNLEIVLGLSVMPYTFDREAPDAVSLYYPSTKKA
jgi:hypothetical protein